MLTPTLDRETETQADPQPVRFDCEEFDKLRELKLLPQRGHELIDGEIYIWNLGGETQPWTFDQMTLMEEAGLLGEGRVELVGGTIYRMAAQRNLHWTGVWKTRRTLETIFPPPYVVKEESTHRFARDFGPEPDVVVLPEPPNTVGYEKPHPLLVVEVSETTLAYDRGTKASYYAREAVADYWVLNVFESVLEVQRNPVEDETAPAGWRYANIMVLNPDDHITPLARPDASIAVANLLP